MIKVITRWYCTICGYGKDFDPDKEPPPIVCHACSDGQGVSFVEQNHD